RKATSRARLWWVVRKLPARRGMPRIARRSARMARSRSSTVRSTVTVAMSGPPIAGDQVGFPALGGGGDDPQRGVGLLRRRPHLLRRGNRPRPATPGAVAGFRRLGVGGLRGQLVGLL